MAKYPSSFNLVACVTYATHFEKKIHKPVFGMNVARQRMGFVLCAGGIGAEGLHGVPDEPGSGN
jgi:hypothetical protein